MVAKAKSGVPESTEVTVAKEALILLVALIAMVTVLSIWGTYDVSHSFYGSVYYTLSSLIDVNNEGAALAILSQLAPFGSAFYTLVGIELLDGIVKVVLIGFIVAVLIDALMRVDISSRINSLRSSRLDGHIVLCGYSGLGEDVVDQLSDEKKPFVVVEKDATKLEELNERGYTALEGDFTDINVLRKAGVEKASAVVFCAETDITNLMGILAARKINKDVTIISRAREDFSVTKMQRAGADLCIIPELVAGLELGNKLVGI
jgi:voltage-gated potassium channel